MKEEEAQRQVESAANEHQRKVDTLIAGFNADLDAFRLTSPAGNNALSKLQTLLVLEPANPFVNEGFEAIVGRYIGLSRKSSSAGQFDKAETYLDKAATVFADSAALEALAKAEERKAQEAAKAEEAAKAKLALATIPESAIEVTKTGPCSPRLLEPRPMCIPWRGLQCLFTPGIPQCAGTQDKMGEISVLFAHQQEGDGGVDQPVPEPRRDSWRLIGLSQAAKADPCSC